MGLHRSKTFPYNVLVEVDLYVCQNVKRGQPVNKIIFAERRDFFRQLEVLFTRSEDMVAIFLVFGKGFRVFFATKMRSPIDGTSSCLCWQRGLKLFFAQLENLITS